MIDRESRPVRRSTGVFSNVLVILASLLAAGCTIGPVGMIAGRVSVVQGGWVMETYMIGAHVRTAVADDPGLGLGVAKRTYLFSEDEVPAPASGWYVLRLPPASLDQAVLRHVETSGVDLHLGAPEPGIVAGLQRLTATRPQRLDDAGFRDLRFAPSSPTDACVSTQRERSC